MLPAMWLLLACANDTALIGTDREELFLQDGSNAVDVLWVVDNSISMSEEQGLVAAGFESFIAALSYEGGALDLHIGVVTTDVDDTNLDRGKLLGTPAWLTGTEANFAPEFRSRVRVGTSGSDFEQGLGAAWLALDTENNGGLNDGFLREDANLALVFVSDENDCSNGGAFTNGSDAALCYDRQDDLVPISEFVRRFAKVPLGEGRTVASAIAGPPAADGCASSTPGPRYQTAADKLGGVFEDVCATDYTSLMDNVAAQILAPARVFTLDTDAQPATIQVLVDDTVIAEDPDEGWVYDAEYQSIRFDGAYYPPPGSEVWVLYEARL
jgi:hypothetical protein